MERRGAGRHVVSTAAAATQALVAGRSRTPGAVVLAYHDVGPGAERGTDYYVTPEQLRRQLDLARGLGLVFVPLHDLVTAMEAGEAVDGLAAVTFDDAFRGVATDAAPVLAAMEVPGTVFVPSRCLGTTPRWWPGARPLMSEEDLLGLAEAGWGMGAHSRHHTQLVGLPDAALDAELAGGRHDLEELIGTPVELVAYPDGRHDGRVRRSARAAGYRAGFTFVNGRLSSGDDPFRLARLTMGDHQGRLRLTTHLTRPATSWPDPPTQPDPADRAPAEAPR